MMKTEASAKVDDLSVANSMETVSEELQEEFEDDFDDNDSGKDVQEGDRGDRSTNNISALSDPSFSFNKDVSVSQESEKSNESETVISRQTSAASDYELRCSHVIISPCLLVLTFTCFYLRVIVHT